MSTSIVYDGVGSGGTLFQGKKIWLAQRIPSRNHFIKLLQANGGEIVKLEKLADIMIADHARKDAPMGSYSWKWIEESIKNGQLVDLETHRIGPPAGYVRPVGAGSSIPSRIGRTPFTPEDDRILMSWVTRAERSGLSIKGNRIYEDLARANPRHTLQSWRDRWIKNLQFKPRPPIPEDDAEEFDSNLPLVPPQTETPRQIRPSNSRGNVQRVSAVQLKTKSVSSTAASAMIQSASSQPASPPLPSSGLPFNKADEEILLEAYQDIMNIDEGNIVSAWSAWAEAYPRHTASEWLKFWVEEVKPLGRKRKTVVKKEKLDSFREGAHPNNRNNEVEADGLGKKSVEPQLTGGFDTEDQFCQKLTSFAETVGFDVDMRPSVCNRPVSLFRIWKVVSSPIFQSFQNIDSTNRWHQVATELNFNTFRDQAAALELRSIYEVMLKDFAESLDFWQAYQEQGEDGDEDEALSEEQDEDDFDDDLDKPPQSSNHKRNHSTISNSAYKSATFSQTPSPSANKKRKQDKGKERALEVPATPENLISMSHKVRATPHLSPLKQEYVVEAEVESDNAHREISSHNSLFVSSGPVESIQNQIVEPETQSFHFPFPDDDYDEPAQEQEKQVDLTPPKHKLHGTQPNSMATTAGSQHEHEHEHEDTSTQSQTDSQREEAALFAFIERYVALGYSEEVVIQSLQATTMETGDAAFVMEAIYNGNGIPKNIQGVWTARDDLVVAAGEKSDEYDITVAKHGLERCMKRVQFLKDAEEACRILSQK